VFESHITLLETDAWQVRQVLQREKTERFVCYTDLHLSKNGQILVAVPHFDVKGLQPSRKLDIWDVPTKTRRPLELDMFNYLASRPVKYIPPMGGRIAKECGAAAIDFAWGT
jgi:hypothetical protein